MGYIADFRAALELFDHCDFLLSQGFPKTRTIEWKVLACRDGAITIYHFGHILIDGAALKDCPSLRSLIDWPLIRSARKRFLATFPEYRRVRHAIAHDAELSDSVKSRKKTALRGGGYSAPGPIVRGGKGAIINSLSGRTFSRTFDGKMISYEINEETLKNLVEITTQYYEGFYPVKRF